MRVSFQLSALLALCAFATPLHADEAEQSTPKARPQIEVAAKKGFLGKTTIYAKDDPARFMTVRPSTNFINYYGNHKKLSRRQLRRLAKINKALQRSGNGRASGIYNTNLRGTNVAISGRGYFVKF